MNKVMDKNSLMKSRKKVVGRNNERYSFQKLLQIDRKGNQNA